MRAVAALLAVALIAGCSDRPRSNPFDPQNPDTGGRPAGFQAVAGNGIVSLRWQTAEAAGGAFRLYRRVTGETDFHAISSDLSLSTSAYNDAGAANGLLHEYRLYFVIDGAPSGLPAEDSATPGPLRAWTADLGARTLSRLSADGKYAAQTSGGFLGPTAVAFDARNQRVWVADTYDGILVVTSSSGFGSFTVTGLTEPVSIAIDSLRGHVWVCDQARDQVYHYTLGGAANIPFLLPGIDTPISVAVDPNDGSIWVCERGAGRVRRYSSGGAPNGAPVVVAPSRVAVDSLTRDAWVTSFESGAVFRIAPDGSLADTVGLSGPVGVAVDARRGRIWIADALAGAVVALNRSGAQQFRVGGLPRVREVAVDPATGDCFATVPGLGIVARVSPTGALRAAAGGFTDPYGIVVEP